PDSGEDGPLEGRMVDAGDGRALVLVDRGRGVVYSSVLRGDDGERLAVGTLVDGEVVLDEAGLRPASSAEGECRGKGEDDGGKPGDQAERKAGPTEPFPYDVNPDDHCETPPEAYRDVDPLLSDLCRRLGKSKSELRIYDPYYCDGSVRRHLADIGYGDVHNERVDCYRVWEEGREPEFDVLVTNPPYSHIGYSQDAFPSLPANEQNKRRSHREAHEVRHLAVLRGQAVAPPNAAVGAQEGLLRGDHDGPSRPSPPAVLRRAPEAVRLPPPRGPAGEEGQRHAQEELAVRLHVVLLGGEGGGQRGMDRVVPRGGTGEGGCDVARSRSALRDLRRGGKKGGKGKKRRRK
ncbi:hypothetical protein THAOC_20767, partial [Thalassiosira oceanica]